MVAEGTKGGDAQVEDAVLQVCAQTEVHSGQSTAEHRLVVAVHLSIAVHVGIITVTDICTILI